MGNGQDLAGKLRSASTFIFSVIMAFTCQLDPRMRMDKEEKEEKEEKDDNEHDGPPNPPKEKTKQISIQNCCWLFD